MSDRCPCGRPGRLDQYDEPVWGPLVAAVGDRLAETFMWMHQVELADGTALHAYKHIHTRRYLHLTEDGRAFEYAACRAYVPLRMDFAIEAALCTWWLLDGWDEEDAQAIRDAVVKAAG